MSSARVGDGGRCGGTREWRAVLWRLCGAHAQSSLASAGLRESAGANGVFQSSPVEVWTQLRMFTYMHIPQTGYLRI